MMDAEDIHEFHYEDGHHRKTYRVSFIPVETLQREYVVTAESKDDAYYEAKALLEEDIGLMDIFCVHVKRDAAKDFQLRDLDED